MSVESDAEELALMINNDRRLYNNAIRETKINLARKMVKGEYNSVGAKKAWLNLVEFALKDQRFTHEYREYLRDLNLSPSVRRLAREYVMAHQSEEMVGLYKKMLALKNAGKPWSMKE